MAVINDMMANKKVDRDNFKDCRFGEIDFAFSPVFKSLILHKTPAVRERWSVKSLKDLCVHKITCYTEVSDMVTSLQTSDCRVTWNIFS